MIQSAELSKSPQSFTTPAENVKSSWQFKKIGEFEKIFSLAVLSEKIVAVGSSYRIINIWDLNHAEARNTRSFNCQSEGVWD